MRNRFAKVESFLKASLNSISSPSSSVKIQIMDGKVFLRCKGKTMLRIINKLLKPESLLTSPSKVLPYYQRYTYRVLQTIQMKLILLCVWAEPAVLGSTKNALKFKFEI